MAPVAVSREDAALLLSVGLTFFEEEIQPELKLIRRGRKRLVPVSELPRWVRANAAPVLGNDARRPPMN